MQKINEQKMMQVIGSQSNQQGNHNQQSNELNSKTEWVVNKLFEALKIIFPAHGLAFNDSAAVEQTKVSWLKAFLTAKLTEQEIRRGVEKMRLSGRPFFPSSGQFIEACKPSAEDLGVPGELEAYKLAVDLCHAPSQLHRLPPVVYDALKSMTAYKLKTMTENTAQKEFSKHYQNSIKKLAAGVQLSEAPKLLPKQEHEPVSEDARLERIKRLKAMLNG